MRLKNISTCSNLNLNIFFGFNCNVFQFYIWNSMLKAISSCFLYLARKCYFFRCNMMMKFFHSVQIVIKNCEKVWRKIDVYMRVEWTIKTHLFTWENTNFEFYMLKVSKLIEFHFSLKKKVKKRTIFYLIKYDWMSRDACHICEISSYQFFTRFSWQHHKDIFIIC